MKHEKALLFLLSSWSTSSFVVFLVTGWVVTLLLAVVLIEKFTCVPKRLSQLIVHLTGNKMLHQMMAITNVLTLLSCVLLPMVRVLCFLNRLKENLVKGVFVCGRLFRARWFCSVFVCVALCKKKIGDFD